MPRYVIYHPAAPKDRGRKVPKTKVLRRLQGFLVEMEGQYARVVFVEAGEMIPYDMPADQLRRIGVTVRNQPFQMDEVEAELGGVLTIGYQFQALAKPSDGYIQQLDFDPERKRKRDLILKEFSKP